MNKGHGRIETRHLQASSRLAGLLDWPGLQQVCRVERTRKVGDKTSVDVQYAITSLRPDQAEAKVLLELDRGHWGIENRLHWVRDVVLGEDKCRAKAGSLPQNLAAFRNLGVSILRRLGVKGIASTLRTYATQPKLLIENLRSLQQ